MNKQLKKHLVLKYEGLLSWIYRLIGQNHFHIAKGNRLYVGHAFMKRCTINVSGHGNFIEIESGLTRLNRSSLSISGNNCHIRIGGGGNLVNVHLYIEDDDGEILLGKHVTISGQTELAVIEGTKILIGDDCLFSSNIAFRTGDSHSIIDLTTKRRINPSADIAIGNHVWIGNGARILKGVEIGDNSIVAMGALLSGGEYPSNSVIGGIGHGKVLKTGIGWCSQRI